MFKNMRSTPRNLSHKRFVLFLSLFWIVGLVIGGALSFPLNDYSVPLMSAAVESHASFYGILFAFLLPVLISLICPQRFRVLVIIFIAFLKGICFGYSALIIIGTFGDSALQIFFQLSFSSLLTLIPLFYLWIKLDLRHREHFDC